MVVSQPSCSASMIEKFLKRCAPGSPAIVTYGQLVLGRAKLVKVAIRMLCAAERVEMDRSSMMY